MILCNNYHHNNELYQYESECFSHLVLQELKDYIVKSKQDIEMSPITENKGKIFFNITDKEVSFP